ncbi:hypothetical protein GCM10008012_48410 [Rhizobium anhuiense]|nr:hypothetical protein GCM10008012_48410 [Rhizobium anhuiense]
MQALDLTLALEIARGVGERLESMEEIPEPRLQMGFEGRPVAAHQLALVSIETGKAQAVAQAACLRSTSLI